MDLTWLGWRTQANTFFFSWDPIAWRDMLEEDLVLDPHMRKDQWRPGQVQWWWSTCPLPVALGWYRQPPHICHPATKIYSSCFFRSSVGASHLTRWKPVQGGKRHFGLLLAVQVNLEKVPWHGKVEFGCFDRAHFWWEQTNLLSQHGYVLWSLGPCNLVFQLHSNMLPDVQQVTSISEGTFSRGWRGRRERRHFPSVFSSYALRAPFKILWSSRLLCN